MVPCRREEAGAQSGKWFSFSKLASFIDLIKITGKYENIYECLVASYWFRVKRPQLAILLLISVMIESFRLEKLGKIWRIRDCLVEARKVFWKAYHLLNFVIVTKSAVCSRPIYDNWRPHSSVVSSDAAGLPIIRLVFRPFSSHFKIVIQPWISFTCFVELKYDNQFGHGTTKLLWKQILRALHRGRFASLTISFFFQ